MPAAAWCPWGRPWGQRLKEGARRVEHWGRAPPSAACWRANGVGSPESDGLPVGAQVGGQPYLWSGDRLCHSPLGKAQKAERLWRAWGVSCHQRRCAAGTGFEELRGVRVEARGHQAPRPGPRRTTTFCSPAPWLSREVSVGWTASRAWHVAGEGLGAQVPGGGRGEDGDLLPLSGPGAWHQGSPPGEAGPAATMFRPTVRPSVSRRLWFPGLGEGPGSPAGDADAVPPFLPRGSPQVTRISTSTVRPMQGQPGRRPQDGEDAPQTGTRLYCESALCRPAEALGPGRGSCCR